MSITLLPPISLHPSSPPPYLFSTTRPPPSPPFLSAARRRITSIAATVAAPLPETSKHLTEIYNSRQSWKWKGHNINYVAKGTGPPLLLVHGFGASVGHWRRNIGVLSENYTVYAVDLIGFGASDKPAGFVYTMEVWAQLVLDFLDEVVGRPTVLVGNSVGSLACVVAASESTGGLVRGLVLLNCAGGMNNKAVVDDWRIKLLLPLLWLFDFLLKQKGIASAVLERVRRRSSGSSLASASWRPLPVTPPPQLL